MSQSLKYIHPEPSMDKTLYIIVGEAPGACEDKVGRPFMGRSGTYLRRTLTEFGVINNCYFTNIIKIRPENNRKPTKEEILTWLPILTDEIFSLGYDDVKLITFGLTAAEAVALIEERYPDLNYFKNNVYTLFHPAYILRSKERIRKEWKELLKEIIHGN